MDRPVEEAPAVTRLEVIDETGRAYVREGVGIRLAWQDDDRTLKVFVRELPPDQARAAHAAIRDGWQRMSMPLIPAPSPSHNGGTRS